MTESILDPDYVTDRRDMGLTIDRLLQLAIIFLLAVLSTLATVALNRMNDPTVVHIVPPTTIPREVTT